MSAAPKPVAKSLHTITVIVQVARLHQQTINGGSNYGLAVSRAMATLGLAGRPDPHGLAAVALKQLEAR